MVDPIAAGGLGLAAVGLTIQIFDGCIKGSDAPTFLVALHLTPLHQVIIFWRVP